MFGEVAANRTDDPRQLVAVVQLLVGNRTLEHSAFAAAQGQQDSTVRAGLGNDLVVGEQGRKFFLDQAHVVQLRDDLNGKHGETVAAFVPVFLFGYF
ncbi:hypothetical protein D3C81_2018720 [compost metagenome]